MSHIVHAVTSWPWPTIAAFAAAAAALWVAHVETRQRRHLLGRENVVELCASLLSWHTQAAQFLGIVRRYLEHKANEDELNIEGLARLTAANGATIRAFKSANLACNDFELHLRIAEAEVKLVQFVALFQRPTEPESAERQRRRLLAAFEQGKTSLAEFGQHAAAIEHRGFAAYSPHRSIRYRIKKWRWERLAKAQAAESAQPPDSDEVGGSA